MKIFFIWIIIKVKFLYKTLFLIQINFFQSSTLYLNTYLCSKLNFSQFCSNIWVGLKTNLVVLHQIKIFVWFHKKVNREGKKSYGVQRFIMFLLRYSKLQNYKESILYQLIIIKKFIKRQDNFLLCTVNVFIEILCIGMSSFKIKIIF